MIRSGDVIAGIETIALRAPLAGAVHNPVLARKREREAIIVRVRMRSGLLGEGYVTVLGAGAGEVVRAIDDLLAPVLVGREGCDPRRAGPR